MGPAALTRHAEIDTQLPTLSGAALQIAHDAAVKPASCTASAAAALPVSSLAAALMQSANASIADNPGRTVPSGQPNSNLSIASMSGGNSQHTLPVLAALAVAEAADKNDLPFTNRKSSSTDVASSTAVNRSRSKLGGVASRATARADPATAPAAPGKTSHSHTAAKPVKHAVPCKPGWQH